MLTFIVEQTLDGEVFTWTNHHNANTFDLDNVSEIISNATNPASSGSSNVLRLGNQERIAWRNAANSADIYIKVTATNSFEFNEDLIPSSTENFSLGAEFFRWSTLWAQAVDLSSTLNVSGNATFGGNVTLGNAASDTLNISAVMGKDINFDDFGITKIKDIIFSDGFGNDVATIQGVNGSPDILEVRLGSSTDFVISDNGTVRADFDNTLQTWSFQGSSVIKLPQETQISDRTTAPSMPPTGQASLYVINSSGAQSLRIKFDNGTEKTIATDV